MNFKLVAKKLLGIPRATVVATHGIDDMGAKWVTAIINTFGISMSPTEARDLGRRLIEQADLAEASTATP